MPDRTAADRLRQRAAALRYVAQVLNESRGARLLEHADALDALALAWAALGRHKDGDGTHVPRCATQAEARAAIERIMEGTP